MEKKNMEKKVLYAKDYRACDDDFNDLLFTRDYIRKAFKKAKVTSKTHKWCSFCKKTHLKSDFYKNSFHKDSLQNECKKVSIMRSFEQAKRNSKKKHQSL